VFPRQKKREQGRVHPMFPQEFFISYFKGQSGKLGWWDDAVQMQDLCSNVEWEEACSMMVTTIWT
jgi:hypothetical protein